VPIVGKRPYGQFRTEWPRHRGVDVNPDAIRRRVRSERPERERLAKVFPRHHATAARVLRRNLRSGLSVSNDRCAQDETSLGIDPHIFGREPAARKAAKHSLTVCIVEKDTTRLRNACETTEEMRFGMDGKCRRNTFSRAANAPLYSEPAECLLHRAYGEGDK
jgi:hypothetical protein